MTVHQSTPRKDSARGAAVARRLLAQATVHPSVMEATIHIPGLSGEPGQVRIMRAGRAFQVGSLRVAKGERCVLVQSQAAPGRWFVCSHHQWSTSDERVIQKCRQAVLAHAA